MAESAALLAGKILPQGSKSRSHEIGKYHYDLGNELFEPMLGPSMVYTCAYWAGGARNWKRHKMQRWTAYAAKFS